MKKLLTISVLMLAFCVLFICTVPAQADNNKPLGLAFVKKIWKKNGGCEVRCLVIVNKHYKSIQAQNGFGPGAEILYFKDGQTYSLITDFVPARADDKPDVIWVGGIVTIPKAYQVDSKIQVNLGYGRFGSGKIQECCLSELRYLDDGILKPDPCGATFFDGCTQEDILRLFNEGTQTKTVWEFRKANPPQVSLNNYTYSGDWAAGTFTQTYTLGFNATCQTSPRSFSIKIKYFANDDASRPGWAPVEELAEIKLELKPDNQSRTITIAIPQIGLSRHTEYTKTKNPIFVRELSVEVTELIPGHESIRTFYDLKVGATVTVN